MSKIMGIDAGFRTSPTVISLIEHRGYNVGSHHDWKIGSVQVFGPFTHYHTGDFNLSICRRVVFCAIESIVLCEHPDLIVLEEPFLQGIGNKDMCKFYGIFQNGLLDWADRMRMSAPTQVKKMLGGGKLEKDQIAQKVLNSFKDRKDKNLIKKAIAEQNWDVTDSLAIAMAGFLVENKYPPLEEQPNE